MSLVRSTGSAGGQTVRVVEAPLSLLDPRVGCTLDGTGDQASKIATAIGLLPTAGGHIYQPPGILRTSAISFNRPVRWEGAGDQASIIKAASGFAGTLLSITSAAPFSRVSDVALDGGGSATVLILVASARTRLDHLHLTAAAGSTNAALLFDGVSTSASAHAAQVSDVRILGCAGYGVYLQGFAYDNEFVNLWVGTCNVGVRIENSDCFFSNLHVWGCTGAGVAVRGPNNRFSNVYIETNGSHGFDVFNSPRTTISNGSIWKNQGQGISLSGTSDRCRAMGLTIYDQGFNGINGADCSFGQVIGCSFYDDTSSAQTQDRPVVTTGTADNWIITGNVLRAADHAAGGNSLVGSSNQVANNIT